MSRPLKLLISAYACEPDRGSEPGVGWHQVTQAARFHDTWVITRSNNRPAIEKALAREALPKVHWVYFDLPPWARFWKKGERGIHLYYVLWQLGAFFTARDLSRRIDFDLAHHVTFVNYWLPTFLPLLPIPFIWGPLGGGDSTPSSFRRSLSLRGRIYETLRDCARKLSELNPFVRIAARHSATVLATTAQTEARLRAMGCPDVSLFPEVGLSADEIRALGALPYHEAGPFRVISVGRLLHLKGFELGLRAFARFHPRFADSEYWIVGDGPERKRLERRTRELGLKNKVVFWGQMSRDDVMKKLAVCDLLLFPGLHESGGWACVEAMAAGRPVICLDLGGPALQVTEATGIKVPAITPEQAVNELTVAMEQLAGDPLLRRRLGEAGRARVAQEFSWEKKGEHFAQLYESLVSVRRRSNDSSSIDDIQEISESPYCPNSYRSGHTGEPNSE